MKVWPATLCVTVLVSTGADAAVAQEPSVPALPAPVADPLRIDLAADPVLRLARTQAPFPLFRDTIAAAVARHPVLLEQEALTDEARAGLEEARERQRPGADITLSTYRVISRAFSNDPGNLVERTRPEQRTDALLSVQQTIFDFGAGDSRVEAAGARLRAAAADVDVAANRVALAAIAAWYDAFAYRALVALTSAFGDSQRELKQAVEERVRQGVSAPADVARVESYIASAATRLARFRRLLANAEARFAELAGDPPPPGLERAPAPALPVMTRDMAAYAALAMPQVRAAQSVADAAHQDVRAVWADRLPQVAAGVDAGRYGVYETDRDYDIRGRLTVRQRLFGGAEARLDQARARARAAEARAYRVREEAQRDAAIAWSDVLALEEQLAALEAAYVAARRSRDVLIERFRAARGSLFDVVAAEDTYFEAATAYIQAITELDAARYVLLSRTGRLLDALTIDPAALGDAR